MRRVYVKELCNSLHSLGILGRLRKLFHQLYITILARLVAGTKKNRTPV
jgi:hypothetical protein